MKLLKLKLEIRQQQQKKSNVYMDGIFVAQDEIQRKAARCFVSTTERLAREFTSTEIKGARLTLSSCETYHARRSGYSHADF